MTAYLPARAPTSSAGELATSRRRRVAGFSVATVVVVAGIVWPVRAEVASTITAPHHTPLTGAPDPPVGRPHDTEPQRNRVPSTVPAPPALAPAPPPDRRDAPDPFILADRGRYVLFSTQVGVHNVPVATSPDLRRWSPPSDALPQLPDWATAGRTWAPGVTRYGGRYLLYFTAHHSSSGRQCIGVATSASAEGPFVSPTTDPLVCQTLLGGSIDPYPFVDADGTAFLLWKADGNAIGRASTLFAQRFATGGLALTGEPVRLLSSGAVWDKTVIENPALIATDQSYALFYSGGWWDSAGYAIGYATCDTPLGRCTKTTVEAPLLAAAGDQAGPGGACVVTGPAGDQWLAYHAWTTGAIGDDSGGSRSLRFASLTWPNGLPAVVR